MNSEERRHGWAEETDWTPNIELMQLLNNENL